MTINVCGPLVFLPIHVLPKQKCETFVSHSLKSKLEGDEYFYKVQQNEILSSSLNLNAIHV